MVLDGNISLLGPWIPVSHDGLVDHLQLEPHRRVIILVVLPYIGISKIVGLEFADPFSGHLRVLVAEIDSDEMTLVPQSH